MTTQECNTAISHILIPIPTIILAWHPTPFQFMSSICRCNDSKCIPSATRRRAKQIVLFEGISLSGPQIKIDKSIPGRLLNTFIAPNKGKSGISAIPTSINASLPLLMDDLLRDGIRDGRGEIKRKVPPTWEFDHLLCNYRLIVWRSCR